jgi:hypothetical protein
VYVITTKNGGFRNNGTCHLFFPAIFAPFILL